MKITKLTEDTEYLFRITAQNRLGVGKSIQSDIVAAKSQFGNRRNVFF